MAERAAPVPYSPADTTNAETRTVPGARLDVRANADEMGAQVGGALQKLGQTGEDVGNKAIEFAQFQSGQANEIAATDADVELSKKVGSIYGQYATLTGSQAVAAAPQVKAAIQQAQQEAIQTLPGGAARAASMLTARSTAQRIIDVDTYAAQQQKQAMRDSGLNLVNAKMNLDLPTASDDTRFGEVVGDVKHGVGMQMNDTLDQHMRVDPASGQTSIDDSTPEGASAKANYQKSIGDAVGQLWANRISVLANDPRYGPIAAQQKFEENKSGISPTAAAHISATLAPQVYQAHVAQAFHNGLSEVNNDYFNHLSNPPENSGTDVADAIHKYGEGGGATSPTSIDGAVGGWQVMPDTFKMYAKPGETIDNQKDNEAVGRRIVNDYKQRFGNDPKRIAVAYFSGPQNVAPAGSPTPWLEDRKDGNGTTTSQYVNKVVSGMGGGTTTTSAGTAAPKPYATNDDGSLMTKSDYMQIHKSEILDKWSGWAEKQMPGDLQFRNAVVERARQQIADAKEGQDARYRQDNSTIIKAINGDLTKGKPPVSYADLAAIPNVRDVLNRVEAQDPRFAQGIDNMISRVNKSGDKDATNYGSGFKNVLQDLWAGKITDEKPLQQAYSDGLINHEGLEQARKELNNKNPLREQTFKAVRAQIAGKADMYDIPDADAEQQYGHAMKLMYDTEAKEKSDDTPESEMYDPQSPKWIGNVAKPLFKTFDKKILDINVGTVKAAPNSIAAKVDKVDSALPDMNQILQARKIPPVAERVPNKTTTLVGNSEWIWKEDGKWYPAPSVPVAGNN